MELFLKFNTQEERRSYGGSDFLEFQYCTLPKSFSEKRIVNSDLVYWKDSSLYVFGDRFDEFYRIYGEIIGKGLYCNLQEGTIDCCGENYYNREKTAKIIERLKELHPKGSEILLEWLSFGSEYNGFYILGV